MEEYNGCSVPQYTRYPAMRRLSIGYPEGDLFTSTNRYKANMHGSNMRCIPKALFLSFLMIVLSFSAAISSLNESTELTDLEPLDEPLYTILPIADLNVSGFQEGSIFTDATLSSGHRHTCMILDNGSVSCWGDNTNGALGRPNPSSGWSFITTTPALTSSFGAGRAAVAISAGGAHTCAILDNGSVSCWGDGG